MKASSILVALLLLLASLPAPAAERLPPVERYAYRMSLDIARVLAVTPLPATCGVVARVMLYRDRQGRLQYRALGAGCSRH
ncbi:TPA: DUF2790 domain-containing protein [Pseudomonas aeruginosa]|nr:DUF2790 domain-containing protein [Pseudomonas aeruginosa]HBP6820080.1 DUF2790 domain-containing protein [Pseudomonas aeruginosa]